MTRWQKTLVDLRTFPADTAIGYRREGLRGVWKAAATRSLHRVFRAGRLIVFAHPLDREFDPSLPPGIRVTRANDEELPALVPLAGVRDVSRFRSLIREGRHCLIAWRGDQPLGYAWVGRAGPDIMLWPLPLEFPPDVVYLWNLYVLPSERGSGIGTALALARLRLAQELGFREGWRMVAPSNRPSLRTVEKTGAGTRIVGEIKFVHLIACNFNRFKPPHTSSLPASAAAIN
jgi:ribosomal protein S18 acetylase RimI-like enzyme